jgi:hypothetical protein
MSPKSRMTPQNQTGAQPAMARADAAAPPVAAPDDGGSDYHSCTLPG